MDSQTKNILKYALILFLITALSATMLAFINTVTKDKIDQNSIAAENQALYDVMKEADSFEVLDEAAAKGYGAQALYIAKNASGEGIGCCIKMAQNGYGGEIISIIGVGKDGIVTGVKVISHSETPGLGAKLTEEKFIGQFTGKGEVSVVKAGAKDNQINAISGATISSKTLTKSVNAAIDILKQIKGEGIHLQ